MRLSVSFLAALHALSSTVDARPAANECKANSIVGADTLHYIIDPEYIIFPYASSLLDLEISLKDAKSTATDRTGITVKQVPQLFGAPCTLTMQIHSTPKTSPQQLETLISTSMANTELFCHSASIKLHETYTNSHTMMSRNTTIHLAQNGVNVRDSPSVSYEVDCQKGQAGWSQQEDCSFCKIVQRELQGMCQSSTQQSPQQAELGKMADDMGLGFGVAKCIRKNRTECGATKSLFG